MSDLRGAEQFFALSKRLKAAGELGLRRELNTGLRKAGKPMVEVARTGLAAGLPKRGGVNTFISTKKMSVVTRTGAKTYGIGIKVNKQDERLDTEGRLAHPVFNRRNADGKRVYVVQRIRPGIFSGAMQDAAPVVRDALQDTLDDFTERVANG